MSHETRFIECECGYEGHPDGHDDWVYDKEHPIYGPRKKPSTLELLVQEVYGTQIREQLNQEPMLRRLESGSSPGQESRSLGKFIGTHERGNGRGTKPGGSEGNPQHKQ